MAGTRKRRQGTQAAAAGIDQRPLVSRIIDGITEVLGTPLSVGAAVLLIVVWAIGGLIFGFSNAYQLVINTGTTIITFIMVFAIQHTQNRETRAVNVKLDELLRQSGADPQFVGAEDEPEQMLKQQQQQERAAARRASNSRTHSRSTAKS